MPPPIKPVEGTPEKQLEIQKKREIGRMAAKKSRDKIKKEIEQGEKVKSVQVESQKNVGLM